MIDSRNKVELVHLPLTSGTRGHLSAFASSNASLPGLQCQLFGSKVQRQLHWLRASSGMVVGHEQPHPVTVGMRLQFAVRSNIHDKEIAGNRPRRRHRTLPVFQYMSSSASPSPLSSQTLPRYRNSFARCRRYVQSPLRQWFPHCLTHQVFHHVQAQEHR